MQGSTNCNQNSTSLRYVPAPFNTQTQTTINIAYSLSDPITRETQYNSVTTVETSFYDNELEKCQQARRIIAKFSGKQDSDQN